MPIPAVWFSCPPGFECPTGFPGDNEACESGWYCVGGTTKEQCPLGHYCEKGDPFPIACPRGTAAYALGGASESHCTNCSNIVCDAVGIPLLNTQSEEGCADGFNCENGANKKDFLPCQTGHYCQDGRETPCDTGSYQSSEGQSACEPCTDGFLCNQNFVDPTVRV